MFVHKKKTPGSRHDPLASSVHPEEKGLTQYMDAVLLASIFPVDRGKAESEYGLIKKF